jgi:Tol biopolymer transport system component
MHRQATRPGTLLFALFIVCFLSLGAVGTRPVTFSMPGSVLLFGTYNNLRVATPDRVLAIQPPVERGYNGGYFASPSMSPRGDAIAWGFSTEWHETRRKDRARFALGVYSLVNQTWKTYGDFDFIGTAAYAPSGSRIAVIVRRDERQHLLIFDVSTESWTAAPYPKAGLRANAAMSWSPDETQLAVEVQRGGLPYSPQMPTADEERNPVISVLDLESGNVRMLVEGFDPAWSPSGEWIAYYAPGGAKCVLVRPDGSGSRVVKAFRKSPFSDRRFVWDGPVWSPDSQQLLFTTNHQPLFGTSYYVDVMLLDLVSGRTMTKLQKAYPIYGWVSRAGG